MSSGGGAPAPTSNYSTGTTGGGSQETSAPAPGGKGGFPSAQNPYAQQQPQVYMPPQQPSFYQQAFPQQQAYTQSSFYAPQQQQGFMNPYSQNAYAQRRPYRSQSSPFDAPKPPGEMQYSGQYAPQAPAGLQNNPDYVPSSALREVRAGPVISDSWFNRRPGDFQPIGYAEPTSQMPQYGGPGATPRLEPSPAAATQGVASDNINNPAYQQQMAASNMTDYQRLMQRKNSASAGPYVNPLTGEVGGVNPFAQVSDLEIANSLGYKDPSANMMSDDRARMPFDANLGLQGLRQQMAAAGTLGQSSQNEKAKEYLNSIGYGQAGFDASKYEVKRQPVSTGTGLGALLGGY
jgi:hypothetical protein